eukprot:TRINITY_DN7339_c0_g1_i1.p1 TRINITY_DN7339_c0_g1~~TRINITY_DN7339_c0_g1_i1.p1  ORF type:complete len:202 (+),score=-10.87 TRINITY_DN7339_c0_g1_i1:491-1096(+)
MLHLIFKGHKNSKKGFFVINILPQQQIRKKQIAKVQTRKNFLFYGTMLITYNSVALKKQSQLLFSQYCREEQIYSQKLYFKYNNYRSTKSAITPYNTIQLRDIFTIKATSFRLVLTTINVNEKQYQQQQLCNISTILHYWSVPTCFPFQMQTIQVLQLSLLSTSLNSNNLKPQLIKLGFFNFDQLLQLPQTPTFLKNSLSR